jgi:hypothetical protein
VETLQTYINSVRRLLHDASGRYWEDADLTIDINAARRRAVADSTCYRSLQTLYLSQGLERFVRGGVTGGLVTAGGSGYDGTSVITFSAPASGTTATGTLQITSGVVTGLIVTNPGSGYTSAPTVSLSSGAGTGMTITPTILNSDTLDVMNLTLVWGQTRVTLDRMPFTQFQASIRAWVGYQQRPGICASYGQDQWYVGPAPDQTYQSEWDTLLTPPDLVALSDTCVIQSPYSDPVAFYAAHLAKINEQAYSESEQFLKLYQQKMQYAVRSAMMRMLPSAYGS